jgi:Cof subfamily protein (haloacid dehalogenase superfamily)
MSSTTTQVKTSLFKMVCSDIDGTLLNAQRDISPATAYELNRVSEQLNVAVVLVSSRMPKAMRYLQKAANISQPIICYNGGLILGPLKDDETSEVIFNAPIDYKVTKPLYEFAHRLGVHVSLYREDDWYVEEMDFWANREMNNTRSKPDVVDFSVLLEEWNKEKFGAHKIMCMGEEDAITALELKIKEEFDAYINVYRSKNTYLEISVKTATKATAISLLQKKYDIDTSEIIAFGDNYNDVEMLDYVGHGVAMGNAPALVKAVANEVTLSNLEDGVAEMVKKYF